MYNLNVDEISMVDGDGAGKLIWNSVKFVASNMAWGALTESQSYSNNLNRTGINQAYGDQGRDTGGCTMQSGGAMAHGSC